MEIEEKRKKKQFIVSCFSSIYKIFTNFALMLKSGPRFPLCAEPFADTHPKHSGFPDERLYDAVPVVTESSVYS